MKKTNLIALIIFPCLLFGLGLVMKNDMPDPAYFDDLLIERITDE